MFPFTDNAEVTIVVAGELGAVCSGTTDGLKGGGGDQGAANVDAVQLAGEEERLGGSYHRAVALPRPSRRAG